MLTKASVNEFPTLALLVYLGGCEEHHRTLLQHCPGGRHPGSFVLILQVLQDNKPHTESDVYTHKHAHTQTEKSMFNQATRKV